MDVNIAPADENFEEFARIIPDGAEAESALDLVCDGKVDAHHSCFIRVERKTRPEDSGSEVSASERRSSPDHGYWGGHYKLSLQDPVKKMCTVGWLMGKGFSKDFKGPPRGVDLLVIRPGKKPHGVASVHARISIHPKSGALLLFGVQEDKPVLYRVHDSSKDVVLNNGQSHVLYQSTNSFSIGKLRYTLVFAEPNKTQYTRFVEKRNTIIEASGFQVPHNALSAIPQRQDVKRGLVVTHGSLSSGGFGWVSSGVDASTGEPLAIKEHRPKNMHAQANVIRELKVGKSFNELQGLLPIYDGWCEHELDDICNRAPQSIFTTSPLAVSDFRGLPWDVYRTQQLITFFSGPLRGLSNLHSRGYIHRDVHRGNLLVMALEPPHAVLGDFGKTIKAASDDDPHLGPAPSRAPEIDGERQYSNKIDIWSLGFAMIETLFTEYAAPRGVVTKEWHDGALKCLDLLAELSVFEGEVADLVRGMLAWDPVERISAGQALQHPCFLPDNSPPLQPPPTRLLQPPAVQPPAPNFHSSRHQRSWVVREATSRSTPTESSSSQGATGAHMLAFQQRRAAQRTPIPQSSEEGLLPRR